MMVVHVFFRLKPTVEVDDLRCSHCPRESVDSVPKRAKDSP